MTRQLIRSIWLPYTIFPDPMPSHLYMATRKTIATADPDTKETSTRSRLHTSSLHQIDVCNPPPRSQITVSPACQRLRGLLKSQDSLHSSPSRPSSSYQDFISMADPEGIGDSSIPKGPPSSDLQVAPLCSSPTSPYISASSKLPSLTTTSKPSLPFPSPQLILASNFPTGVGPDDR